MTQRQVTLEGGVPWGFRIHGGADLKTPLKVSRVNPGSKAAQRGIREGDLITSINGESTDSLTNNEAHSLLKRSGSILKLGLNEDTEGSPKKRHYRTIHHETHQETVKRSSVSYTLKETIERSSFRSQRNNEFEAFKPNEFINIRDTKQNGSDVKVVTNIPVSQVSTSSSSSTSTSSTLVPEGRNISSDHAIASRQSSYSNCSSIPDEGPQQGNQRYQDSEYQEMNDGQDRVSKSKKRRQRRKNLLNRSVSQCEVEIDEIEHKEANVVLEPANKNLEILRLKRIEHKYKVESPKELRIEHVRSSQKKLKIKSKSLDDDDDLLRIQELSEASESEDPKCQTHVIITEASSEENLREDSETDLQGKRKALSSLQLESTSHISPEEEQALRHFLGGLKLVNSPEESAQDLYERTTVDPKAKKQQKRKELEEYFKPIAENPRYLDAISEEASDLSDKESGVAKKAVHHLKQGTPEHDLERNDEKPILVEAKVFESVPKEICCIEVVPASGEMAEVVFLEDSCDSSVSTDSIDKEAEIEAGGGFRSKIADADGTSDTVEDSGAASCNNCQTVSSGSTRAFNQLTPPPTPDIVPTKTKGSSSFAEARMHFDYTKMPNVLKEKEPANGHVNGDGGRSVNSVTLNENTRTRNMDMKMVNGNLDNLESEPIVSDTFSKGGDVSKDLLTNGDEEVGDSVNKEEESTDIAGNVVILSDKNSKTEIEIEKLEERCVNEHIVRIEAEEVAKNDEALKKNLEEEIREPYKNTLGDEGGKSESVKEILSKTISHKRTENNELIDELSRNFELERSKDDLNKDIIIEKENCVGLEKLSKNGVENVRKNIDKETKKPNKDISSVRGSVFDVIQKSEAINETFFKEIAVNQKKTLISSEKDENKKSIDKTEIKNIDLKKLPKNSDVKSELIGNKNLSKETTKNELKNQKETYINVEQTFNDHVGRTELRKVEKLVKERVIDELEHGKEKFIKDNEKKNETALNKSHNEKGPFIDINTNIEDTGHMEKVELKKASKHSNVIKLAEETNLNESSIIIEKTWTCDQKIGTNENTGKVEVKNIANGDMKIKQDLKESINKQENDTLNDENNIKDTMQCKKEIRQKLEKVSENGDKDTEKDLKEKLGKQNKDEDEETATNETKTQKGSLINIENTCQSDKRIDNNKTIRSINEQTQYSSSEMKKESVLKHVIMTCKDSNKTDSQKLLEFESIKKLNSELKDKINRQELIGPAFKGKNVPETVVMHCEQELPSKDFIQRRVKEFSKQENKETNNNETEKHCNNLIQSRSKTFSNKSNEELQQSVCDGSVLKRIILLNGHVEENIGEKSSSANNSPKGAAINKTHIETVIPVTLEYNSKTEEKQLNTKQELKEGETLIPIELESPKNDSNKEVIIPIKIEDNNTKKDKNAVKIIPIQVEDSKHTSNIEEQTTNKQIKIIPIEIEKVNNKHTKNSHKDEHIVPIKIENKPNPSDTITTNDIRNINKSLINIVEKKEINNEAKSIKPQQEARNEPPIPPPRRSKAFLLRRRNETPQATEGSKEDIPVSSDMTYTNILSPPRPASASSDSSASEGSSRCTAKYNPNSSIGDVASITKLIYEPMSLRDIVLKRLMSLPFGEEILKELAEVSKAIGGFTNNFPFRGLASTNENNNISVCGRNDGMPGHWYTTQSDTVRNSYGDERHKIMELHQKFLTRRKYDEDAHINVVNNTTRETEVTSPNRLLTIIREESNESEPGNDFLYYESNTDQRLKARNLGEWLTLARNKSKSTSNLDRTNIPINNLRRAITGTQNEPTKFSNTRRLSLPQEIYEEQLITIMEKEREIQRELEKLEEEKRKLRAECAPSRQREFQVDDFYVSKRGDFAERRENIGEKRERPASMPVFPTEFFRQQMYEEYMDKFSEREERKQQKVIKISSSNDLEQDRESHLKSKEIIHPIEIEQEFMDRVKEKQKKNHKGEAPEEVSEQDAATSNDMSSDEAPVIVLDGDKVRGIEALPPHLQEFVGDLATHQEACTRSKLTVSQCDKKCCKEARRIYRALAKNRNNKNYSLLHEIDASLTLAKGFLLGKKGIWSPGQPRRPPSPQSAKQHQRTDSQISQGQQDDPVSPVWTPKSANSSPTVERKEFRPVNFQSPVLSRKNRTRSETIATPDSTTSEPPWRLPEGSSDSALNLSSTLDRRLPTSQSSPGFGFFSTASRLPKAQNPTITLLQKAREGQLPRGAHYIDQDRRPPNDRPPIKYPGEVLYHIKNEYTSESDSEKPKKMADLTPRKFEGIGPTTKDGMPLILRSEVKDKDQSKWYKRMYDTIHKQKPHKDEFITVRYKQKRAHYPYSSGYLSEPEPGAYDSDFTEYKYQTLDRRRTPQTHHYINSSNSTTMPRSVPDSRSYSSSDIIRSNHEKYSNQPGRIENYRPGHSSISEKEAKQWWDEVMDIFDGHLEQQSRVPAQKQRSFINQALKESGYESDSTLVFKRKQETAASQLSPKEQREAYKIIQKGGDVPFQGLRKPAPERPKETDLVEFFPISPTLTKIRIHKSIIPPKEFSVPENEFFFYPATVHHNSPKVFANFKRTAPSSVNIESFTTPPPRVPSPPKRKSSRNNSTLRLISTMKKSPTFKRHETCFTSGPNVDKTKVNYLRDKISCKLSPRGDAPKVTMPKKVSMKTSNPKTSIRKVQSSGKIPASGLIQRSGSTGSIISKKSSTESLSSRVSSPVRTFGTEKKKFDLTLPNAKLSKTSSEELLSPTEVKKGMKNISVSKVQYKESLALLGKENRVLPIKVGITEKGKNILKTSIKKTSSVSPKQSPSRSISSERSGIKKSLSVANPKPKAKISDKKTQHKSKKDQINDTLKKGMGKEVDQQTTLDKPGTSEISQQKDAIESNHFFRNLFLRNFKQPASVVLPKNSWLTEKTNQLSRRRTSTSEPSIGAMKIYLKHTRPVSDSKFISLDVIRSRSASPKSVTFSDETNGPHKRSKSLPSKIVFSQTSRPVSPVVEKKRKSPILKSPGKNNLVTIKRTPSPQRKLVFSQTSRPLSPVVARKPSRPVSPDVKRKLKSESPPPSPLLPRSPSSRRIMQKKQQACSPRELTLYSCPELKHSTTSLDSFRSEDYHVYLKDLVFDKSEKFKELSHFYNDIEKVNILEQKFASKPRKISENHIIDYDRWIEVRTRERAEDELKYLYSHIKDHEKEKGFLFLPKDVERYRWKKELDRGLRIKEKSVENIKEEFERLKEEESDRECARRREIAYCKDTYKPLWRGTSVINLASILTERRSQSEGRVKTARLESENLFSHRIGSRIWSSLSTEQVNKLKKQLQEIYGDEVPLAKDPLESPSKQYIVEVPNNQIKKFRVPQLTVRRNSESAKPDLMSEDEKKIISQTLSKEVLEKISRKRKEDKLALPLVIGKEVLGAVATKGANVRKEEPPKALVKTNALTLAKQTSISETESASTDESTKTVINLKDVQKKVEYFEKAKELETYVPTVYKPAEDGSSNSEEATSPTLPSSKPLTDVVHQSKSCQDLKEYFGESDLVKFATLPLSATRKSNYTYVRKPQLRALDLSPIRTISQANSIDSLNRSRSASPYSEEAQALMKKGEVKKLRRQFEYFEDFFGEKKLKRSRSENDLRAYGHVEDLRRKYEYPAHSGRGRSRVKRGGMVSPVWLRPEDRYMPHINIISKIASLYSFSKHHHTDKEASKSMEELAEILGCPVGEVEKMKEKFDKMREQEEISLMGHMYTSSPNLRELRDITPYLTANWIAHKYPRSEDNTRSLSSPETSVASRDTSIVRRDRCRPKSSSPVKKWAQQSILKHATERFETSSRYTKEPDLPPPPPPPKSQGGVRSQEQESPRKYVENEVTIHYKTPVRTEIKEYVSEDELAHRQAEAMKKIYEEERKRKYLQVSKSLQELQDMKSRRHTDNFIPSQKSPIPLNRYDDFDDLATPTKARPRSPEPRLVARALYNFLGQSARELTFRKGDLIYVRRQVDKNWYEGELNAMVGLFPVNYVEIVPYEGIKTTPRKAHEGQARAKYNFVAQTHLELSLAKGELVTITRKVDDNWFEGKIGGRKGIFPVSYVDVLIDPSEPPPSSNKPVAAPAAHSLLLNGSAQGKESMGSHLYTPNIPNPITSRDNGYHHAKPIQLTGAGTYSTLPKSNRSPIDQALHIETQSEPIPYRALYKYMPQNDDELELLEGDTVYVLEKCDDGWYVGSSDRTGAFGTFPGNYVEKI